MSQGKPFLLVNVVLLSATYKSFKPEFRSSAFCFLIDI